MKNIPKEIYLQIGEDNDGEDFNALQEVTWCVDQIYKNDIKFVLSTTIQIRAKNEEYRQE